MIWKRRYGYHHAVADTALVELSVRDMNNEQKDHHSFGEVDWPKIFDKTDKQVVYSRHREEGD